MEKENSSPFEKKVNLHKPLSCSKCGGSLKYTGLGEYECSKCGFIERDDYGKVRTYLEVHGESNMVTVSEDTGVSKKDIQRMLDEDRFTSVTDKNIEADKI